MHVLQDFVLMLESLFVPRFEKKFWTRIEKDISTVKFSRIFGIENKTAKIAKKKNEET